MDFFSRLSVGSKVAAVISALVIVCIAILAFFITTIASKTINQETRFILEQASYRYGNLLHSVTKDVMGTLLTASATINN
ncbi:MAG: methyl-accepting chemotaxis protein, partial [Helicobacter sp.]|nr:methyl-accepting chemotaxis protein [Helicobacter sp.]